MYMWNLPSLVISNTNMGASLVQCYSIKQMHIFYKQKIVVLMMLLRIYHCWSGPNVQGTVQAWKNFQSKHKCQMAMGNGKKCCGNGYTGCPSRLSIKCILQMSQEKRNLKKSKADISTCKVSLHSYCWVKMPVQEEEVWHDVLSVYLCVCVCV